MNTYCCVCTLVTNSSATSVPDTRMASTGRMSAACRPRMVPIAAATAGVSAVAFCTRMPVWMTSIAASVSLTGAASAAKAMMMLSLVTGLVRPAVALPNCSTDRPNVSASSMLLRSAAAAWSSVALVGLTSMR